MNWHIFAVGRPKLAFAKSGVEEYAPRVRGFAALELSFVKASARDEESAALLKRSAGMHRIALDERGALLPSAAFAERISALEMRGTKNVALLIGGADGHAEALRREADWLWSLSPLTTQHELALVLALEQIYRAYTIKAGLPYHRA